MSMPTIAFVDEYTHLEGTERNVGRCRYHIHQAASASQFLLQPRHCGIGISRVFQLKVEQELVMLDPQSSILAEFEQ
jgi:hypothetical protein